jgi:glyoxylate utilization-related uncharacterized protein
MSVRVDFQPTRGLKLHLLHIDSNYTIGLLQKQRQMSIERLLRENGDAVWLEGELLVTRNQKHDLPLAIRRIAVLSSEQSAGYQDFLHTLQENLQDYRFELTLFPVLVQGEANVQIDDITYNLQKGETINIPLQAKHRVANLSDVNLIFIETQLGSYFGEDDIVRINDKYGRI